MLVEPREPERLATAIATVWADDAVHGRIAAAARERAKGRRRTWSDVASDTRAIYAEVGTRVGAEGALTDPR
jgi:glycosyltransferase involved in cell wall biosynthesis